jgi:hypothetical protein
LRFLALVIRPRPFNARARGSRCLDSPENKGSAQKNVWGGPEDHYFFRPEADIPGNFLWLSAPGPLPGSGDLQTWIRNDNLAPDWERVGTDVVGGTTPPTFNASFSLPA